MSTRGSLYHIEEPGLSECRILRASIKINMTEELNFEKEILKEHRRAELQRIKDGWAGCGCSICQDLYKTIDIDSLGDRAVRTNVGYIIKALPRKVEKIIYEED